MYYNQIESSGDFVLYYLDKLLTFDDLGYLIILLLTMVTGIVLSNLILLSPIKNKKDNEDN